MVKKWFEGRWFGAHDGNDYIFRGKDFKMHRPTEYESEEEMLENMAYPYCFDYEPLKGENNV